MTAILKHNLDMAWETSPARDSVKLKKARLTPRPFNIAPRSPWRPTVPPTMPAAGTAVQRRVRTSPAVLRALREAELAVWNKALPQPPAPVKNLPRFPSIPVGEARTEIVANEKVESRFFYLIAVIAAAAVAEGVWGLFNFLEHWSAFVDLVQRTFAAN
jgi:hypothetical protein